MKNRLQTESTIKSRGNPYYKVPGSAKHRRTITIDTINNLSLHRSYDQHKGTDKNGNSDTSIEINNEYPDIYDRNLAIFRDAMLGTNSMLPFLTSLRKHRRSTMKVQPSQLHPFEVSSKQTCNTRTRKKVSDFTGSCRLHELQYLWIGKTNMQNKRTVEYDCTLRDYGVQEKYPRFRYLSTRAPHKPLVEPSLVLSKDVICDKFKKYVYSQ